MRFFLIVVLVSILLQSGCGVKSEREVALRRSAQSGDADAQLRLALAYSLGDESTSDVGREYVIDGVHQDPKESAEWMLKSAENGNSRAERITSNNYFFGIGFPIDYRTCVFWLEMATAHGDADAFQQLSTLRVIAENDPAGAYTEDQRGILRSALGEFELSGGDGGLMTNMKKEALSGDPAPAVRLGNRYLDGVGVRKNHLLGWTWLLKAADLGSVEAQTRIGLAYVNGDGVAKDAVAGNFWLKKAAQRGYDVAEYDFGISFLEGEGVPKDRNMGLAWIKRSAAHGNARAIETLKANAQ